MSARWQYKVGEVPMKLFSARRTERAQDELDKLGPQGWELVSIVQSNAADTLRLFLKRAA